MNKNTGVCALCRKRTKLSFEHIPPQSSFNTSSTKMYTGESLLANDKKLWELNGIRYSNSQRGAGLFSLCEQCNNLTGSLYGTEYKKISAYIDRVLRENIGKTNLFFADNIYPNRFIKQVISMFCSINNPSFMDKYQNDNQFLPTDPVNGFCQLFSASQQALSNAKDILNELREFVLDKNAIGIDKSKVRISMYVTRSSAIKYNALCSTIDVRNCSFDVLSEIVAYPNGFLLYVNPSSERKYRGTDITSWADFSIDESIDMNIPLEVNEVNSYLPNDYRSRKEILRDANQ